MLLPCHALLNQLSCSHTATHLLTLAALLKQQPVHNMHTSQHLPGSALTNASDLLHCPPGAGDWDDPQVAATMAAAEHKHGVHTGGGSVALDADTHRVTGAHMPGAKHDKSFGLG